ncbi:MAG TPA: class I SAM-dependent methyltransferase [Steroidobacteraceae bacterium]|nr:class I SAM-dependent methyltransferase [Steroidobacteraceae bacterium]
MSSEGAQIDVLNKRTMRASVQEYESIVHEGLNRQEKAAFDNVAELARRARILDIGVGAGRTVSPLRDLGQSYLGVDYVQEMVDHCRARFPGLRFERADARDLSMFPDGSFDLVFFSCNGICMVDHPGRLAILAEARRLLSPGGVFIFSTCNRNSERYRVFRYPDFQHTANPVKWLVRAGRFAAHTLLRVRNRRRHRRHEIRTAEYAVLNTVYHHYTTMLYVIEIPQQLQQLVQAGFSDDIKVFGLDGRPAGADCQDGTLTFVARKA